VQAELAAMPPSEAAIYAKFLEVEPQYLQAGLNEVHKEYGSMYGYVTRGLGVSPATVARLREKLREGAPESRGPGTRFPAPGYTEAGSAAGR
jgi:protein-tyrosine phosphatase